jgi:hypothetical protein
MANPARTDQIDELAPRAPAPEDDRPVLGEREVLETLENSDPTPAIDAPKGIALAMGLGAAIWLAALALYAIIW